MVVVAGFETHGALLHAISAGLAFTIQHGMLRMFLTSQRARLISADHSPKKKHSRILSCLFKPKVDQAANRLVACTHAFVAIILGFLSLTVEFRPCGSVLGNVQRTAMQISLGYFCYDLLFELVMSDGFDMIIHHAFAVLGLACGLYMNRSGTELMGSIFAAELSTPLLHLRFFLRFQRSSPGGQNRFDFVSLLFFIVFLTARIVTIGPVLTVMTVVSPTTPFLIKLGGVVLYLISLYWGILLIRMAVKQCKVVD